MGDCKKCAQCCYTLTDKGVFTIPLTSNDATILKKNSIFQSLEKQKILKITNGNYDPYYKFDLVAKGTCPFLDQTVNRCIIYEDRPSNCRSFECFDYVP
jgi:Fe-S-cluster containining protein